VDQAPEKSNIRRQKDKYLREFGIVHRDLQGLFDEEAKKAVKPQTEQEQLRDSNSRRRREDVNEAMRMYRLLRPDAPPFYEEDAALSMQARANHLLESEAPPGNSLARSGGAPLFDFQAHLPVVNPKAFLLALESVVASLADDVETLCLLAGFQKEQLPDEEDPLRFKLLLDSLFGAFPLRKDPSHVDNFMEECWPRLRNLLPREIAELPQERVADWLRGHLTRVRLNQRRNTPNILLHSNAERFGDEEMYSFAEDFPYDDDPVPGLLADERNLDFPLERAGEFMATLLRALSGSPAALDAMNAMGAGGSDAGSGTSGTGDEVASQFQELVWDLEKVGLRNWLRMDVADFERFLPRGEIPDLSFTEEDVQVAKTMLKCAVRGRADLLDFDAVDPYKLLHEFPAQAIEEELQGLPASTPLPDAALVGLVEARARRIRKGTGRASTEDPYGEGATVDEVYRKELDFYRTAGPVEWTEDKDENGTSTYSWKWRQPQNTFWDPRRNVYNHEQKGVDPTLSLKEMRQHLLEMTRMGSMTKNGRINYFRAIVVVGNGKGIYGFGVGFGQAPKEARSDAALKALQNLDYIDYDPGRMLCTPTRGLEYKHLCTIVPRPIGRGVKANKKFLPLVYILGLENCKISMMYSKWFTRIRAIKRALDMVISRRTLANMTGKRYALLVAPGDHWVHWPDRWFDRVRETYDHTERSARLARRHILHFKKRSNVVAIPQEVKPGWRKQNWIRWNNPLERWLQHQRSRQGTLQAAKQDRGKAAAAERSESVEEQAQVEAPAAEAEAPAAGGAEAPGGAAGGAAG